MQFDTLLYLAQGDTVDYSFGVGDYVPESGDYLWINNPRGILVTPGGLTIPTYKEDIQSKTSGAMLRLRNARAMPVKIITLQLTLVANGSDDSSVSALRRQLAAKLEQARAASGPFGLGTRVVLLVRLATQQNSQLGNTFATYDILDGVPTDQDLQVNPSSAYGMQLQLRCLPYGRVGAARTWPQVGEYTQTLGQASGGVLYLGPTTPSWPSNTAVGVTTLYPRAERGAIAADTPTGLFGGWDLVAPNAMGGALADWIDTSPGTGVQSQAVEVTGFVGTQTLAIAQFASQPLAAGTIASGTWTIGIGSNVNGPAGTWTPMVACYLVDGSSDQLRATIIAPQGLGARGRGYGGAQTCYGTVAVASSTTVIEGDYLVWEIGATVTSSNPNDPITAIVYTSGTTAITSDDVAMPSSPKSAFTYSSALQVRPVWPTTAVGGQVGAMLQLHVLDQSTGGACINQLFVARRNVPGAGGGMAEGDWQCCIDALTGSRFGETYTTGDATSVNGDYHRLALTDGNVHTLARFTSDAMGSTPLYQNGYYDVFARIRESVVLAPALGVVAVTTSPSGTQVLVPDTYNVAVRYDNGTSTGVASGVAQITVPYVNWPPNGFYEDFEGGDDSNGLEITDSNHGTGDITVTPAAAIAGGYGMRVRLFGNLPRDAHTTYYTNPQQSYRRPISLITTVEPLYFGGWCMVNGGFTSPLSYLFLGGIGSSYVLNNNPPGNDSTGMAGAPTTTGFLQGYLCALTINQYGQFGIMVFDGTLSTVFSAAELSGSPLTVAQVSGLHLFFLLTLTTTSISTTYSCSLDIYCELGHYTVSTTGTTSGVVSGPYSPDYVDAGLCLGAGGAGTSACAGDVFYDDLWTHNGASVGVPFPGNLIVVTDTGGADTRDVYFQRQSDPWREQAYTTGPQPQSHTYSLANLYGSTSTLPTNGLLPAVATPSPVSLSATISAAGATGGLVVPETIIDECPPLGNAQWHLRYLGTFQLPPIAKFEGLSPTSGSGAGDMPWQIDLSVQSGAGSSTNDVDADCVYVLPADEPPLRLTYVGMDNSTLYEWVADTRLDGRTGAVLRSASDLTTVDGHLDAEGYLQLGVGNQSLAIIAVGAGYVHDVEHIQFAVQLRYQALIDGLDDQALFGANGSL